MRLPGSPRTGDWWLRPGDLVVISRATGREIVRLTAAVSVEKCFAEVLEVSSAAGDAPRVIATSDVAKFSQLAWSAQ